MSIIKELFDLAKEGAIKNAKISVIKRALRAELKLNKQILLDIEYGNPINDHRRQQIIKNLEIKEISAAVKYDISYKLICRKIVDETMAKTFKIKRLEGFDFEMLAESLYLKIAYLKKDYKNKTLDLNLRLINIYKYNRVLLELFK